MEDIESDMTTVGGMSQPRYGYKHLVQAQIETQQSQNRLMILINPGKRESGRKFLYSQEQKEQAKPGWSPHPDKETPPHAHIMLLDPRLSRTNQSRRSEPSITLPPPPDSRLIYMFRSQNSHRLGSSCHLALPFLTA